MEAGIVEMLFSFGVVLAIAIWDLLRTPKPSRDERRESASKDN